MKNIVEKPGQTEAAKNFLKIQKDFQKELDRFNKAKEKLMVAFDSLTEEDKLSL